MSTSEFHVSCPNCSKSYDNHQLVNQVTRLSVPCSQVAEPGTHWVPIQCSQCNNPFYVKVTDAQYAPFSEAMNNLEIEAMESYINDEPDDSGFTTDLIQPEPQLNKLDAFVSIIKGIDKNLDAIERTAKIRDALATMVDEASSDIETCLKLAKDEFGLTARDIEAFRKDLNSFKAQREMDKKRKEYNDVVSRFSTPPKELTEQEKQEALAYLSDPNLINNISRDIGMAGEVVGEEINKMMLYFASISRKFKKPMSLVIFGKSSSGKSYLANAIEKFVPPEDKLILSSSSARAFEYLGEFLKNKFVLVQEWEGMEAILPTIRTLQSEGRLSRLVTVQNPDDKTYKSVAKSQECPCCVVVTTTKEGIHDENSTRIFELYADDTVAQTENVVRETIRKASIKDRKNEAEKSKVLNFHHNIQRTLEAIEIDIPYAGYLTFPARTTRNRRDSERFIQLIKTIAFLRQKQKEIKFHDGIKYIEADLYDYEIAYLYGIPILSATLDQISTRAKNALVVCCALMDDLKNEGKDTWFTVNQIQEKAPVLGLDFGNRQDLYKQLNVLTEHEYLDLNQPKPKGTKYYTVIFNYVRDESGAIINIGTPEIKEITTPDVLRQKLSAPQKTIIPPGI